MSGDNKWLLPSERPGDGDSIWLAVLEWDGVHTHVECAVTFYYADGTLLSRCESNGDNRFQQWPLNDVLAWMPCDVPQFEAIEGQSP